MNNSRFLKCLLILAIAIGLHTTLRGLSSALKESNPVSTPAIEEPLPAPTLPRKQVVFFDDLPPMTSSFSIPEELKIPVDFWVKVYSQYTTHQAILHDSENLALQYGVLDFTAVDNSALSDEQKKEFREKKIIDAKEKFQSEKGTEGIRAQFGLKDRFEEGLRISEKYLPHFERIFEGYGVPSEITRLVFVESLFQQKSMSKVGAAGLWQFMPSTAKLYITVNRLVDERYDPFKATHAAARLLLKNYQLLGSWPLAINAYNSGPGNMQKAIERLGTHDITKIIRDYRSSSYAFASRNFYPSFLAAKHVYDNQKKYFGHTTTEEPFQ